MSKRAGIFVYSLIPLVLIGVSCAVYVPPSLPTPPSSMTDFPLHPGNTWTYLVGRYDGFNPSEIATSTYIITETVISVSTDSSYYVATMRREPGTEFPIYVPASIGELPHGPPTPEDYWLIADGNRLYRQWRNLDLSSLHMEGELDLMLPLQVGAKWHQSDEMAKLDPENKNNSMLWQVTRASSVTVPAGTFENCYLLEETIGGVTFEDWFCPGVGWVDMKADHHGTPFGDRRLLLRYQLKP